MFGIKRLTWIDYEWYLPPNYPLTPHKRGCFASRPEGKHDLKEVGSDLEVKQNTENLVMFSLRVSLNLRVVTFSGFYASP